MKQLILITCLFSFISCKEEKKPPVLTDKQVKQIMDSLELSMPKPVEDEKAEAKDYDHCIDLRGEGFLLTINGQRRQFPDLVSLDSIIRSERKAITQQRLNIITGSATTYKKIVDLLDLIYLERIKNYKVLTEGAIE